MMKSLDLLYQLTVKEVTFAVQAGIIPSLILGLMLFITGFFVGMMVAIMLGIINGVILGLLCILFLNKQKNSYFIKYTFAIVSIIVTFICVYILAYSIPLYYNHATNLLNKTGNKIVPHYNALHILSTNIALVIALIAGYCNYYVSGWYLAYCQKEQNDAGSV